MDSLGSINNPFENVDSAFQYLLELEHRLYEADEYCKLFRSTPQLVCQKGQIVSEWLYPDTASYAFDYPSDSFIVTKQASGMFQFKPNLAGRKLLFRGQTKDFPTCTPNLFRNPNQDYFLTENILCHEMWEVIKTHPLFKLLSLTGINLNGYDFKMYTNYAGITQHYYNKTVFLDLTSDVETAKFFACCDYLNVSDNYIPHTSGGIGVIYIYEINYPIAFQRIPFKGSGYIHLSTIGKQVFPRSGAQHGFLMELSKGIDFNDMPNVSKVYFKHNSSISKRIFQNSLNGKKYMPPSPLDIYWQEKLSSPKTDRTISRAALETNRALNPHETISSLSKKLKKRGFTIINESPRLQDSHLHSYYQDIKNGWWEDEFSSDIFFYGESGKKYQEAFRSLPSVPEYQWAFNADTNNQIHPQTIG